MGNEQRKEWGVFTKQGTQGKDREGDTKESQRAALVMVIAAQKFPRFQVSSASFSSFGWRWRWVGSREKGKHKRDRCWGRSFPILPCPWERRQVLARALAVVSVVCRARANQRKSDRPAQTNSVSTCSPLLAVTASAVISLIPQGKGRHDRGSLPEGRTLAETSPPVARAGLVSRKVGRGSRIGASREGARQTRRRQNTLSPHARDTLRTRSVGVQACSFPRCRIRRSGALVMRFGGFAGSCKGH